MRGFINKLLGSGSSTYPQVFRATWSELMLDSDVAVVEKYAQLLEQKKDLTKEELIKILDDYSDSLYDLTFKVKDVIAVDPMMAIRWCTVVDWIQTANQLLFSRLSTQRRREISTLLLSNLSPMA